MVLRWVLAVALSLPGMVLAGEESGPQEGQVFISGLASYYELPEDLGFDDDDVGPGAGIGWAFSERWAFEALYFNYEADYALPGDSGEADADAWSANLLYQFPTGSAWQPYFTFGGGRTEFDYDGVTDRDRDNAYNLGFGFFLNFGKRIALRGDVRGIHVNDNGGVEPFAMLGLTAMLGRVEPDVPPDADADGVADAGDRCPGTPPGTVVGADGCEIDSDGDDVVDSADECPDTAPGTAVDGRGCPLDADGDGVPDSRDDCPNSEAGARVDESGCYVELTETVTIDLMLEFDVNSAELRPEHYAEIRRVVDFLRQYPTSEAVIEGHTDSTGAADYNQQLSERRANAVLAYLVNEARISANRLRAVGFGETQPRASNETAAGRQQNRRVSAVISGERTVRQE